MDDNRILDKLESIQDDITEIMVDITEIRGTASSQHNTLKEHTRRSIASETRVEQVETIALNTNHRLDKHFATLRGALWVLTGCASVLTAFKVVWPLLVK